MSHWRNQKIFAGLINAPLERLAFPVSSGLDLSHGGEDREELITNIRYLGSYDVVNRTTIVIPGSPRVWSPPTVPFHVSPDTRALATEHNEYKLGLPMFESVFAAIDVVGTDVTWPEVDIVTNRRALRHLYRWLDGANNSTRDNFRIDIDVLGEKTMLFSEVARTFQFHNQSPGYGVSFEIETTDPILGCETSKGHHRIVQYTFGGLRLVVRFETDARVDAPSGPTSPTSEPIKPSRNSPTIIRAGEVASQDAVVEIKTTKGKGRAGVLPQTWPSYKWRDVAAQLLLSGTRRLHTGLHVDGNFYAVEEHEVDERTVLAEQPRVAANLRRLAEFLGLLRRKILARGGDERALSIVCQSGQLWLYERTSRRSALAEEFKARFNV